MAQEVINVPLVLSYDTRGVEAFTESSTNGRDQRRVNCIYEVTRGAQGAEPTASLVRRPGVTGDGNTYGANTQTQYLVTESPARAWGDSTAWVIVKDGNSIKAHSSASSVTILTTATDYVPRFVERIRLAGTEYVLLQLQNTATPDASSNAQLSYYASALDTWAQVTATAYVTGKPRGKIEMLDGYGLFAAGTDRIYNTATNNLQSVGDNDYITVTNTQDELQGLARLKRNILAFGRETVEAFEIPSPGNATGSILNRISKSTDEVGLGDIAGPMSFAGKTHYYCRVNDMLFYLGRYGSKAKEHSLIVYDGNRHSKLTKEYEDKLLSTTTVYSVNQYSFYGHTGVAIQMTAPTATTQKWLWYAIDLNDFFEFESTVFGPVNNGYQFLGATDVQKLYYYDGTNKWIDQSTTFTMTVQFKLPARDPDMKEYSRMGVIGDTISASENLNVSFSKDDGATWGSSVRTIDLSKMHKYIHKPPIGRELMIRMTHVGTKEVRLRRFFAERK